MKHLLYMSLRSPFARRVRLALEELSIPYDVEAIDVFNVPLSYDAVNPLRRVPVLRTPDGTHIVDSWMILDHLRASQPEHPLFLYGGFSPAEARGLSGLAVGVMEHIVMSFLERMRGPGVSPDVLDEVTGNARRGFEAFERRLAAATTPYLTGETVRLCDLDLGTAAGYAALRLPEAVAGLPALAGYCARLTSRPSFARTVPPA